MLWNSLIKKPILVIGILMLVVVYFRAKNNRPWGLFHNEKLIPTSCRAVLVKIEKDLPSGWNSYCDENNLTVEAIEKKLPTDMELKPKLYRQLANHLSMLSKLAPNESLERVFLVRLRLLHPTLELNAVCEGKYLAKLKDLDSPTLIAQHLQSTVKIQEITK
jgi:hypothetical protein